jgi:hypothetical protein
LVFENLNLNENMRLIGMYPHYDDDRTFEKYNFIIEDIKTLDSITKIIIKGKEISNQSSRNEFTIRLFDGNKKLQTWSFNPKHSYIRTDGKSYEFDANQILDLTKKFGFKYTYRKKHFSSQKEFDKEYSKLKVDNNFLFVYKPDFRYEGTFEVKYPKTEKLKHPKAISQYLRSKIGEIRNDNEYRVYYVFNDYNRKNSNQFTMTIESDSGLFKSFNDNNGEIKNWKANEYTATIFFKN